MCIVIPTIKSDRAGQPGVGPRGDGLDGTCASECVIASPPCHIDHVYCFTSGGNFFCPPVLCWRGSSSSSLGVSPLVFGVELASLLEDPTLSIGMISWFVGGAMNLAGPFENFI